MKHPVFMEARGLSYFYGSRQVLFDVDCQFRRHTVLGVTGASGSGKTTLLHAVAGLLPDGVRITGGLWYDGHNLLTDRQRHRALRGTAIALVPQQPGASLYPLLPVWEQFRLMARARGQEATWRQQALQALEQLNLPEAERILDARPYMLSGGQAQRVCLAMALLQQPELLLMDEPTSGLDVAAQNRVYDALTAFRSHCDTSLVVVSHNLGFLARLCDCLLILKDGRTVEQGEAYKVLRHPQHPYTQSLLAAASHFQAGQAGTQTGSQEE
ncbi:MAG: ABC transporter ATP-binding protein [Succiniclasticum sp.]|jgi:ABC-type glutathione transport system ATPase component